MLKFSYFYYFLTTFNFLDAFLDLIIIIINIIIIIIIIDYYYSIHETFPEITRKSDIACSSWCNQCSWKKK